MDKYRQASRKISVSSDKELEKKINALGAVGDMTMTINTTTPEATDTKQWYVINYFVRE